MKLSGANQLLTTLVNNDVNLIFGYPGAANSPIFDKISEHKLKYILVRNEQGAAHMANGYARSTGKIGVCTATSGPGATNLITGIATAYMDSVPMLVITGQVVTGLIGKDAFQEVDITGATIPFIKHNYLVKKGEDIARIVKEAIYIATTGRPGPVLIDIPQDVLLAEHEYKPVETIEIKGYKPTIKGNEKQVKRIVSEIKKAKKPIILAGGGLISSNSSDIFKSFVEHSKIPVISTLMGIGAIPSIHELYFGMIGSHGVKEANVAMNNADLIIAMGARFSDRAIANLGKLEQKTIIHIDVDPAEIGKNVAANIPIVGDIKEILKQLIEEFKKEEISLNINEFVETLTDLKKGKKPYKTDDTGFVNPKYFLSEISSLMSETSIVTTEVGQNQIWAANHYKIKKAGSFLSSGGFGTMGYGLPAAIGAKAGKPNETVLAICGDGSFQMCFPELATTNQWNIPIKIILFNNNRLGMVREYQLANYKGNYVCVNLDGSPDYGKISDAYGISSYKISENSQIKEGISKLLADDKSFLLEVMVDPLESTL